ncbi:hypothetical protein EV182_006869, partial [Spiromyces aspiralis]
MSKQDTSSSQPSAAERRVRERTRNGLALSGSINYYDENSGQEVEFVAETSQATSEER